MARTYKYKVDVAFREKEADWAREQAVRARELMMGPVEAHQASSIIDGVIEAAATDWLLERPMADVRDWLDQAAAASITSWAAFGQKTLEDNHARTWLATLLVARNMDGATDVARGVTTSPGLGQPSHPENEPFHVALRGEAQLVLGDDAAARASFDELTALLDAGSASVLGETMLRPLAALGSAVAAGDQAAVDVAARARESVRATHYGRTATLRRSYWGLVDLDGLIMAAAAHARGMSYPEDVADVPAEWVR